jgi:phage terminase small subunit
MAERKLTAKQTFFVAEYQKDFNGTQAAIRAGYSAKNADVIADQLLGKTWVSEAIQKAMKERLLKIGVHAERVLTELARIGFSDIRKLFNENGSLKNPQDWDADTAAAVAGVQFTEEFEASSKERKGIGTTKRVRMFDKVRALEMLMKHLGLFPTDRKPGESDLPPQVPTLSKMELSARLIYILQLALKRQKEHEQRKKNEQINAKQLS